MSVDIYAVAVKRISEEDVEVIQTYNALEEFGHEAPIELLNEVKEICGKYSTDYEGPIAILEGKFVEVELEGEGDVMYGNGMVISIADLPENTTAIRIYAS